MSDCRFSDMLNFVFFRKGSWTSFPNAYRVLRLKKNISYVMPY